MKENDFFIVFKKQSLNNYESYYKILYALYFT